MFETAALEQVVERLYKNLPYEQVNVVERKIRHELIVDRTLVREKASDECLVGFDLAKFVEDVK